MKCCTKVISSGRNWIMDNEIRSVLAILQTTANVTSYLNQNSFVISKQLGGLNFLTFIFWLLLTFCH